MSKWLKMSATVLTILLLLLITACKTAKDRLLLTVSRSAGVLGFPQGGIYFYDKDVKVPYDFSADQDHTGLTVTLDGTAVASSGNVLMDGPHLLAALCTEKPKNVVIAAFSGSGHFWSSNNESQLTFAVTLNNQIASAATISDFKFELFKGGSLVLSFSKTGCGIYCDSIVPPPAQTYRIPGGSTFSISMLFVSVSASDIYNGQNPDTLKITVYISEDSGWSYIQEGTAAFTFQRS